MALLCCPLLLTGWIFICFAHSLPILMVGRWLNINNVTIFIININNNNNNITILIIICYCQSDNCLWCVAVLPLRQCPHI